MAIIGASSAVSGISTNAASATQASQSAKAATVNYDQFLKLLVAELRNQDPTKPTDPTAHVSQLASFSAVEQQVKANTMLGSLLAAEANQIIGRTVTSADGLSSGVVASVTISTDNRMMATLRNGTTIALGPGIRISAS
jgi:flagellar basal-body rod modification protein FlgD